MCVKIGFILFLCKVYYNIKMGDIFIINKERFNPNEWRNCIRLCYIYIWKMINLMGEFVFDSHSL